MANPYLQVEGLTKSFGDLVLFQNINFGVAEGQRIGLIAKKGSGKTTLLSILSGKEGYDEGSIVYRRDLRVGYLEQDPQYPEELTVLEACFYHGTPVVQLIKEYEKCMDKMVKLAPCKNIFSQCYWQNNLFFLAALSNF